MIKAALLSNINLDSLRFKLKKEYDLFLPAGYNTWRQEVLNDSSDFYKFQAHVCFLIFDGGVFFMPGKSDFQNDIDEVFSCIEHALEKNPQCRFFISDVDVYSVSLCGSKQASEEYFFEYCWSKRLETCMNAYKNAYRFSLKNIVLQYGRNNVYSPKMWYLSSNRFSIPGVNALVEQMKEYMRPLLIPPKKCLVLDLDNTLWGGVIGETGVEGVQLDDHGEGARFYDFQKILKVICTRGTLLAIISKNNREDVEKVFAHPQMLLQKNDFAAMEINWNNKSDNIAKIAHDLNIGLDSFVFVDDNPVEREEMKQRQPDVIVPDFPLDTAQLAQFAVDVYNRYFYSWNLSEEDMLKSQMYRENALRDANKNTFSSLEDFLLDMDMKLSVKQVGKEYVVRTAQMTQKTNQFNLTANRYSEDDILKMLADTNALIFLGHIKDKYGDNGNSILAIIRLTSSNTAVIDSFLMSCRIMNRTIEFGFLYEIEKMLAEKGIEIIHARYIKTAKNSPAAMFFEEAGYTVKSIADTEKWYELVLNVADIRNSKKCYAEIERYLV